MKIATARDFDRDQPQGRADWELRGESGMTRKQQKMLNACCGCLADQLRWHGYRLSKDGWRYFFSGTVKGFQTLPAWDNGDGRVGVIMLGASSRELSKSMACDAITMALALGDDPSTQGIDAKPVRWSDAVLLGLGFNPADFREVA
jgi:hypothetical protein